MSTNKILYNEWDVNIVYNSKLKHSYIKIDSQSNITLKTPKKSQEFILKLLKEKEPWLQKQLNKLPHVTLLSFNLEDEMLLFGECYSIDSHEATFLREKIHKLKKGEQKHIVASYDAYYKNMCDIYLKKRVQHFAQVMNLDYSALRYRKMKSRWGSCSSRRVLTFNSELIKIKKELIDYVVVHELSHLIHMNHSRAFHALVKHYLPDSDKLRKELKMIRLS